MSGLSNGGRIIAAVHILVAVTVTLVAVYYGLSFVVPSREARPDHLEHLRMQGYTLESQASGKFLFERERPTRVIVFRRSEPVVGAPRVILFLKQFGPDWNIKYLSLVKRMDCGLPAYQGNNGQEETLEIIVGNRRLDLVIERATAEGTHRHELRYGRPHGDYELLLIEEVESSHGKERRTRYLKQRIERADGSVIHAALPKKTMSENCY